MRATKIPTTLKVDVPVAIRDAKNLEDTLLPVKYRNWQRSFWKLPKFCEQRELTFLLTVAFRATKIWTTLRADAHFSITCESTTQLITLFPLTCGSATLWEIWVRHIKGFPFRWVRHHLSSVTVALRATKIPTTLRVDIPVAIRATKNLKGTMLPVNYWSWQRSFSELPKTCQQWELTFLSTVAFWAVKIPTTFRAEFPVAFRATLAWKALCFLPTVRVDNYSCQELQNFCKLKSWHSLHGYSSEP